jgi:uncharacterized phage protein (predicted DNA packaging)
MKLSELTLQNVNLFLRAPDGEEDVITEAMLAAAKSAVLTETGLTASEADALPDITLAVLALVGDLYENRTLTAQSALRNPTVDTILRLHRKTMVI